MRERNHAAPEEQRDGDVSIDPICGSPVVRQDAPSLEYRDKRYFFCSEACRQEFARHTDRMHVAQLAKMGGLFTVRKVRWGVA